MSKKKTAPQRTTAVPGNTARPAQKAELRFAISTRKLPALVYLTGFILLYALTGWVYGDVLECTEQYSYISPAPDTMYYISSQPLGWLWLLGRWALLCCRWAALGGAALAAVFTLTAWLADRTLRLCGAWMGAGFLVPLLTFGWIALRGVNIFYRNEPSLLILVPLGVLALTAALYAASRLAPKGKGTTPERARPYGLLLMAALTLGTGACTRYFNENTILTARFKNLAERQDWETIITDTQAARRPSRAVAAYYAVALQQTGQLLNNLFDIPFDFPKLRLDHRWGSEEYGLFTADCNYYAGLANGAYRGAMDELVMGGPSLRAYKRMAACALINGEFDLCRKNLDLISHNPAEGAFVKRYETLLRLAQGGKLGEDAEMGNIIALTPKDSLFEQNYQQPLFLGYNVGLQAGTDASLATSAAASLYSKDLRRFYMLANIMQNKGMPLTTCMQQAVAILSLSQPDILKSFPSVGRFVPDELRAFLIDAKPYAGEGKRLELRAKTKKQWLGTYMYYYYTENNDPDQVVKRNDDSSHSNAGVN